MNDLEKMITKMKKVYKGKANQIRKRNDRKHRIKNKKCPVGNEQDNASVEKIGE